jgi:transposase
MTKRKPKPKPKNKRRTYSDEFKREAVNLVVVEGLTVTAAARDLGINPTVLRNWKLQYDAEHEAPALIDDERLEMGERCITGRLAASISLGLFPLD